jgi:hypothetical protein
MLFRPLAIIASFVFLTACSGLQTGTAQGGPSQTAPTNATLVGAWEVTVSRSSGVGKNLLTFSSDGTFFRSGDTHPVVSGGHGAWRLVGPNLYQASYVSFLFDTNGKWTSVNRNNLQISLLPDGNGFTGTVKSSNRDLQDNVIGTGSSPLSGKRIQVQPF